MTNELITTGTETAITIPNQAGDLLASLNDDELMQAEANAIRSGYSDSTRAMMASVAKTYEAWCQACKLQPRLLTPARLIAFMIDNKASRTTQAARAAHLKAWMKEYTTLHSEDTDAARCYALLTTFKLPKKNGKDTPPIFQAQRKRRQPKRFAGEQVYRELHRTWGDFERWPAQTIRNRAILAVAFYAWLRRSELAALTWDAIDLESKLIAVTGGKHRAASETDYVPMFPQLIPYLEAWRAIAFDPAQRTKKGAASLTDGKPQYVFCEISKGGRLLEDKPMSGQAIKLICGDDFMPHDARRTGITSAIEAGTPMNMVQKMARHKDESTTLKYAEVVDVKRLAGNIKLGY